jgi:peptidoglycan L-alanyl-D-glutamate endopeptidase CwlK
MTYHLGTNSKKNREGVDTRLIEICDLAITLTTIDFGIPSTGGLRDDATQHSLYLNGKSKLDGYKKESKHQDGKALDFYAYVSGTASWDAHHLAVIAAAFLQAASILGYQLQWGGLWKSFKDYPHVQLLED